MRKVTRQRLTSEFEKTLLNAFPGFAFVTKGIKGDIGRLYKLEVSAGSCLFLLLQYSRNDERFTVEIASTPLSTYPFECLMCTLDELEDASKNDTFRDRPMRFRLGVFIAPQGDAWWPAAEKEFEDWFPTPHSYIYPEFVSLEDSIRQVFSLLEGPTSDMLRKQGLVLN